jgi:hypothetical protein
MKYSMFVFTSVLMLSTSSLALAASCDGTARGAAEDFMSEQMDEACSGARGVVASERDDVRANGETRSIYEIDVHCGGSVFHHEVVILKKSCEVLSGGAGDA